MRIARWIGVVLILIGLIIGGWAIFRTQSSNSSSETPSEEPILTKRLPSVVDEVEEELPTVVPLDREEFDITVLNGSGIAGEAAVARQLLEEGGFSVTSTRNADAFDYQETVIQVSEEVNNRFTAALEEALAKSYVIEKIQRLASGEGDVVVIIGQDKQ